MRFLVICDSQCGSTEQYARWIAEELDTDAVALKDCSQETLRNVDTVIFGGSVRGGIISGESKFSRMAKRAGVRKIIWFATGIRPATPRTLDILKKNNFGSASEISLYYFRGRLDPDQLKQGDRTMLHIYQAMLSRSRERHPEDDAFLKAMKYPCDYMEREQTRPLLREAEHGELSD